MVDAQTLTTMFGGVGIGVAAIYYMLTIRNTEKQRRKDFLFQAQLARTPEYYKLFSEVYKMHDYSTRDEWEKKYSEEQKNLWSYLTQHFNVIGLMYIEGIIPAGTLFKMYPTYVVIGLWELSEKSIKGFNEVVHENPWSGFEAIYREAKMRNPKYVPFWKRNAQSKPQ
jgi:hypothetical protein